MCGKAIRSSAPGRRLAHMQTGSGFGKRRLPLQKSVILQIYIYIYSDFPGISLAIFTMILRASSVLLRRSLRYFFVLIAVFLRQPQCRAVSVKYMQAYASFRICSYIPRRQAYSSCCERPALRLSALLPTLLRRPLRYFLRCFSYRSLRHPLRRPLRCFLRCFLRCGAQAKRRTADIRTPYSGMAIASVRKRKGGSARGSCRPAFSGRGQSHSTTESILKRVLLRIVTLCVPSGSSGDR